MNNSATKHLADTPITVLLVDDDPDCRMILKDAISSSGVRHHILEAADARSALRCLRGEGEWARSPRPGLIYLDLEMPGMNGIELLQCIKDDPALRDIPVVMLTGVSDENLMRQAAEIGANSYTIKPMDAGHFLRIVQASANYWLTIHQYPDHHLGELECRR
jgi:CheY-like chemotaxis protein